MVLILFVSAIALCMPLIRNQLLTFPMNTMAYSGQRVEFECSRPTNVTLPLEWDFLRVNSTRFQNIYRTEAIEHNFLSRYNISTSVKGRFALVIDSVDADHAGTYRCKNTYMDDHQARNTCMNASAQLVVIDSVPLCNQNTSKDVVVEGDHVHIFCAFNYSGNWVPVMEYSRHDGLDVDADIRYTYESRRVTSSFIKQLVPSDNGVTFTCKMSLNSNSTNYRPANVDENEATNIPYYQFQWNYTATVLYGPRNISIVRLENRLLCAANGNPNPNYTWTNFEANILTEGPVHLLDYAMESYRNYTIQCEANNSLASEIKNISHFQVPTSRDSSEKQDDPNFLVTALAIGGSLLFLLMMAVVVSSIIHTDRLTDNTNHRPDVALHTDVSTYESGAGTIADNAVYAQVMKPKESGAGTIADNAVYAQVMKPKGPSKGNKGGNIGESSRLHNAPKDVTGADGTVYAELSGVKPPDRKGKAQVPKTPTFNKVEIYASIDHCGNSPAPPLPPK